MIPWEKLGVARLPDGGEMRLMRRGQEISVRVGTAELMNSRLAGSEEALATLGCAGLPPRPSVLIGGLGLGFTLRAALRLLPVDARVTVAELVPELVHWASGPLAELFAGCLHDRRVSVSIGDVGALLGRARYGFDAILLDVDNGPEAFTVETNDALYGVQGLARARGALRPGGILAIWSAVPDPVFAARLGRAGFSVDEHRVKADRGRRGSRHVVWVARRPR